MVLRKNMQKNIIIVISILGLLIAPTVLAQGVFKKNEMNPSISPTVAGKPYTGTLRVYIVEIESRWKMENRQPYHYAFYDYAYYDELTIPYLETFEEDINWQGDIAENNVIVLAAVFNPISEVKYADPPIGRPFDAYFVDAAAGAHPGETNENVNEGGYTHTVFCEVGTATWCPSCPSMAYVLDTIFESSDLPFFFVEMVTDESNMANSRMGDFNLKWLPTAFYDGGNEVVIGGGFDRSYHEGVIQTMGQRDVHELDLSLSVTWVGNGEMDINIQITNNEELPNTPPDKPSISGASQGKPGEEQSYEISASDPDGDDVSYLMDWDDGTATDWIGPYASGETITIDHTWEAQGTYTIRVKAKDTDGEETDWTTMSVSMPKQKLSSSPILQIINQIMQQFPLLQTLLNL